MIPLLVVSGREELYARLVRALGGERPIFTAASEQDALSLLRTTAVDLIIQDLGVGRDPEGLARAIREIRPGAVLIAAGEVPPPGDEWWSFFLPLPMVSTELNRVLRQAEDRAHLLQELGALRRWAAQENSRERSSRDALASRSRQMCRSRSSRRSSRQSAHLRPTR